MQATIIKNSVESTNIVAWKPVEDYWSEQFATPPKIASRTHASIISTTFPHQHFFVEGLIAEGDKTALHVAVRGVPIPPGASQPIFIELFRIEHGRVAEI